MNWYRTESQPASLNIPVTSSMTSTDSTTTAVIDGPTCTEETRNTAGNHVSGGLDYYLGRAVGIQATSSVGNPQLATVYPHAAPPLPPRDMNATQAAPPLPHRDVNATQAKPPPISSLYGSNKQWDSLLGSHCMISAAAPAASTNGVASTHSLGMNASSAPDQTTSVSHDKASSNTPQEVPPVVICRSPSPAGIVSPRLSAIGERTEQPGRNIRLGGRSRGRRYHYIPTRSESSRSRSSSPDSSRDPNAWSQGYPHPTYTKTSPYVHNLSGPTTLRGNQCIGEAYLPPTGIYAPYRPYSYPPYTPYTPAQSVPLGAPTPPHSGTHPGYTPLPQQTNNNGLPWAQPPTLMTSSSAPNVQSAPPPWSSSAANPGVYNSINSVRPGNNNDVNSSSWWPAWPPVPVPVSPVQAPPAPLAPGTIPAYGSPAAVQPQNVVNPGVDAANPDKSVTVIHERFYLEDGNLLIQVKNVLYKVHRHFIAHAEEWSPSEVREIAEEMDNQTEPLEIKGVEPCDFDMLLSIFYPKDYARFDAQTVDEWAGILRVANELSMKKIRTLAIEKLSEIASPADRIMLAKEFDLDNWLVPAYEELCMRSEPLSEEEGNKIGVSGLVKIAKMKYEMSENLKNYLDLEKVTKMVHDLAIGEPAGVKVHEVKRE